MQLAKVIGTAVSTVKHDSMQGWKLLVVRVLGADGTPDDEDPKLVVDALGAGVGETIMITSDGRTTRELLKSNTSPVRWCTMGICDP